MLVIKLLGSVVLADFVSGVVHWFEDSYVHSKMRFVGQWLGQVAADNRLHHSKPRAFLAKNWWQSSWDIALFAVLVVVAAWALGAFSVSVLVFALLVANANQIHKWTHQSPQEKGWLVHRLQKLRILQTPRQHGQHHTGTKNTYYCAITNLTNPVLEKIRFWRNAEWLIARVTGVCPLHAMEVQA